MNLGIFVDKNTGRRYFYHKKMNYLFVFNYIFALINIQNRSKITIKNFSSVQNGLEASYVDRPDNPVLSRIYPYFSGLPTGGIRG